MSDLHAIRNGHLHAPGDIGVRDLLLAGGRVVAIGERLDLGGLDVVELDAAGRRVVPGLVDGHLHVIGGGGNEGYASRIPELWAGELALAGITTVVAPPGLDMVAKSLEGLLAKTYALDSEGISAYAMAGGFQRPFRTVTGSLLGDLFTIERFIGVKVALGEVKATPFRDEELVELAAQLHYLAGATGKACLLHAHLGQSPDPARQFLHAMRASGVPAHRFQATHGNYTEHTMQAVLDVAAAGGYVDFNPILTPAFGHPRAVPAAEAVVRTLAAGVDPGLVTMTTDGNASVPILRADGTRDVYEKSLGWLWDTVTELVREHGVPLELALSFVTSNPARALGLDRKGHLGVGADADLLVLDDDLIVDVFARGRRLVADGKALVRSMYEPA
ncbi:amidohydrolase family protein [Jiangella alba]|uniref:Beta-aspartyl-dipeptidase (Metallo-type) n=1 Tax=Jiangella alba TaxID=561176 RepID=A0A1H5KVB4_9ACTN|nr:amidohydrolase family protein [Jiangella alba]SEE68317.1 beta-aspartyl-dipeptidase (metallo-type) [Jiangella alba]